MASKRTRAGAKPTSGSVGTIARPNPSPPPAPGRGPQTTADFVASVPTCDLDTLLVETVCRLESELVAIQASGHGVPEALETRCKVLRAFLVAEELQDRPTLKKLRNRAVSYLEGKVGVTLSAGAHPWPPRRTAGHIATGVEAILQRHSTALAAVPDTAAAKAVAAAAQETLALIMAWLNGDLPATSALRASMPVPFDTAPARSDALKRIQKAITTGPRGRTPLPETIVRAVFSALGHENPNNLFR